MKATSAKPFWQCKTLAQMTKAEWESVCDGCGRCCLHKIEEEETGAVYETSIACLLLDDKTCCCRDYRNRKAKVPDCIQLTRAKIAKFPWLPRHCAYRLLAEGRPLKWWHYLVSGSRETVHEAGISARNKIAAYEDALETADDYIPYITHRLS